ITTITVKLTGAVGAEVATATVLDASILQVLAIMPGSTTGSFNVRVKAGEPGSTKMTVLDPAGTEIDHATITILPTAEIGIDKGWDGEVLNVLAGQPIPVHATTWGSKHEDLTGVGAVQFAYSGVLQAASPPETFADQQNFRAGAAGDGTVIMSAIAAK